MWHDANISHARLFTRRDKLAVTMVMLNITRNSFSDGDTHNGVRKHDTGNRLTLQWWQC